MKRKSQVTFVLIIFLIVFSQASCDEICDCDEGLSVDAITLKIVDDNVNEAGAKAAYLRIGFKTHVFGEDEFSIEAGCMGVPGVPAAPGFTKQRAPVKGTYKRDGDRIRFTFTGKADGFDHLIDPGVTYFIECQGKDFKIKFKIKGGGRELSFTCDKP